MTYGLAGLAPYFTGRSTTSHCNAHRDPWVTFLRHRCTQTALQQTHNSFEIVRAFVVGFSEPPNVHSSIFPLLAALPGAMPIKEI